MRLVRPRERNAALGAPHVSLRSWSVMQQPPQPVPADWAVSRFPASRRADGSDREGPNACGGKACMKPDDWVSSCTGEEVDQASSF